MYYDFQTGFVVVTWADKPLAFVLTHPWTCFWMAVIMLMLVMVLKSLNRRRRFLSAYENAIGR